MLLDTLGGYQATSTKQLFLYMDDLKLFAKNDAQLHTLLCTVNRARRYGKFTLYRGKAKPIDDVNLGSIQLHVN